MNIVLLTLGWFNYFKICSKSDYKATSEAKGQCGNLELSVALPCNKSDICCCSDLQTITRNSQAALTSHRARSRSREVTTLPDAQEIEATQERSTTPDKTLARAAAAPALEETSNGGGMLHESLGNMVPITRMQSSEDTDAGLLYSDEDYEEDIIEPRTLNEITTVTDKTSPWSSFVSDTSEVISPQPHEVQKEGPSCPSPGPSPRAEIKVRSSFLSSPEKAVNSLPRQGSPTQSLIAYEGRASKAGVEQSNSTSPHLFPRLKCSGIQQSNTFVGWSSSQANQDKEPEPEARAEDEAASSELSDSTDSFEKFLEHKDSQSKRENKEPPTHCSDIRQKQVTTGSEVSTKKTLLYPLVFPTNGPLSHLQAFWRLALG